MAKKLIQSWPFTLLLFCTCALCWSHNAKAACKQAVCKDIPAYGNVQLCYSYWQEQACLTPALRCLPCAPNDVFCNDPDASKECKPFGPKVWEATCKLSTCALKCPDRMDFEQQQAICTEVKMGVEVAPRPGFTCQKPGGGS